MKAKNGFTLIEVVIVLAVVMLLYAVISPALFAARTRAKETRCASNMHQTWLALQMYRQDFNEMPDHPTGELVPSYIKTPSILVCPLEYRDLQAMNPDPQNLEHDALSSYIWPCCVGPTTDAVYARRGELTPALICDVHTHTSSGAPFFQVVHFDGSLSHVPQSKLWQDGDSWGF